MDLGLNGQHVLITGGSKGIGLACAQGFLAEGARVTNLMIDRYLDDPQGPVAAKLRAQIPSEYAICITPRWVRGHRGGG